MEKLLSSKKSGEFDLLLLLAAMLGVLMCIAKLAAASHVVDPIVMPDECAYNSYGGGDAFSFSNMSVYSFASNGGRGTALAFNSIVTTLPLFFIAFFFEREFNAPRKWAIALAAVCCLFAPLWGYSLLDMTEGTLLLFAVIALAFYSSFAAWATMLFVKPFGVTGIASRFMVIGFIGCLVSGVVYSLYAYSSLAYVDNIVQNILASFIRIGVYSIIGSVGLVFFCLECWLRRGKGSAACEVALSYLVAAVCLSVGMFLFIPSAFMFGRYFDSALLLVVVTGIGAIASGTRRFIHLKPLYVGTAIVAAFIFFALVPSAYFNPALDQAMFSFIDVGKAIVSSSAHSLTCYQFRLGEDLQACVGSP